MTNVKKMAECNSHETHNIYPNLNDPQQFILTKINEIKDYFAAQIKERELMSKSLSNYIASFGYFDKSSIVLSVATGSISIASFTTIIRAPAGIVSASFGLAFAVFIGIVRKLLKTTRNQKKKHDKIVRLAKTKLNSIESKISDALLNSKVTHKDFMTIINELKKYRELKESIRMMNCQGNDTEKINLIEEGNEIDIDAVIKYNEIINKSLKSQI